MDEFWLERWQEGRIGWHEPVGNKRLREFWTASGKRVLVPLCGKSCDLIWLNSQGNEIVGVELSEMAIHAFFTENELEYRVSVKCPRRFSATDRDITIVCGDYFEFFDAGFDACFDRAALIALPPELRPKYVRHTKARLVPHPNQLIITLEYDQSIVTGPPYSVAEKELRSYWPDLERVDAREDIENCPPKFREAGLEHVNEVVWRST